MSEPKTIRLPKKTDLNLIYSSWLHSYRESPDNPISGDAFFSYHKLVLLNLLKTEGVLLSILCNPDDLEQIYGWVCYEFSQDSIILHWIHVKYSFRRLGFARFLMENVIKLAESKGIFNPVITITGRGLQYKQLRDKIKHIYKPKLLFKLLEIV